MSDPVQPIDILVVDDDLGDVAYARESFAEVRLANRVTVIRDGLSALAYLRRQPPYADVPRPDLLLLAMNLPLVDGRTVLETVRADPRLAHVTVVVLTASSIEEQVLRDLGIPADRYVRKPVDFEQIAALVRTVAHFYLRVETRP